MYFVLPLFLLLSTSLFAKLTTKMPEESIKYRTSFGICPSRSVGNLTLDLVKIFEKNKSLKDVKEKIVNENLMEKHFLSDYKINYNPIKKRLEFFYECPEPLMKVQVYKNGGLESYDAILVENGKLFDPTYEVLLRTENKFKIDVPYLAIPIGEMDKDIQYKIADLVKGLPKVFRKMMSEVIINEQKELTIILSSSGVPTSVFFGQKDWSEKVEKLQKIISYTEKRKKIPAIVNLSNLEKIVVKFSDKF